MTSVVADATVASSVLTIEQLWFSYESNPREGTKSAEHAVLQDIDLTLPAGEVLTIVGPSGGGKSTLLHCIAGLVEYDHGRITVCGSKVTGPGRERAVVFQRPSLLPWRTIRRNVEYGCELLRIGTKQSRQTKATEELQRVGLGGYAEHYPHQLSGGMQQRANLARALAVEPTLLLMDEPFGALDAITKEGLQEELLEIVASTGCAVVFVTHDIEEAVLLGDTVGMLRKPPEAGLRLYGNPHARPRSRTDVQEKECRRLVSELRGLMKVSS